MGLRDYKGDSRNLQSSGGLRNYRQENETNNGGFLGGLGYIGSNFLAGIVGIGEGIYDFIVGSIADLFGADEYAKKLHDDDIAGRMRQEAYEKFNPDKGWQFAGDVASGLGQSALAVTAGALTGGSALAAGATIGLGAAGQGVTQAYQKSGKLGFKEYAYGATAGALETGTEYLLGAAGKAAKRLTSAGVKSAAKTATRKGIFKTMLSDGAGEFAQESLQDLIDPYVQNILGIDAEARPDLRQALYSGLVGFVSGGIGGGLSATANNVKSHQVGKKLTGAQADAIISDAKTLAAYYDSIAKNEKGLKRKDAAGFEYLKSLKSSLSAFDAEAEKVRGRGKVADGARMKMLLGEVARNTYAIEMTEGLRESRENVKMNAENLEAYYRSQGKNVTAKDIYENKDGILDKIAVEDYAGKLMFSVEQYATQIKEKRLVGIKNYTDWLSIADESEIKAIGDLLGVDLRTATYEQAMEAMRNYSPKEAAIKDIKGNGKAKTEAELSIEEMKKAAEGTETFVPPSSVKPLPAALKLDIGQSGVYRLKNGIKIGLKRGSDGYYIAIEAADGTPLARNKKPIPNSEIGKIISKVQAQKAVSEKSNLDTQNGKKYNLKDNKLIGKTFPYYKDSQSEANQLAARWALREDIKEGWQTLISYHNNWYVIEKFSDMDGGYQIIKRVAKSEYNKISEEIKEDVRNIENKSLQESTDKFNKLNQRANTVRGIESSFTNDNARYGRKNNTIQRMGEKQYGERETSSDRNADNGESGGNQQGRRFSLKNSIRITDKREYSVLRKEVMRINAEAKGEIKPVDCAFTANNFYVYENYGDDSFKPLIRLDIEANKETIGILDRGIKNGDYGNAQNVAQWIRIVQGSKRRNDRDNPNAGKRRESVGVDELYGRESEINGKRNTFESGGNQQGRKYSLKDCDGNALTKEQAEFFKDSKVVDEKGQIIATYHGSPNKFFTFDRERIGKGNDQFGAGFYFATSEDASRRYGENIHKAYLNIQKPIVINRTADGGDLFDVKITKNQAYEILKRHPLIYDSENSPLGDIFEEYWEVGAKDYMIREAAANFDSIGLLDSDYTAFRDFPNELHEAIREVIGYDGVEIKSDNTADRFYVAWFENQIKLATNKQPTNNVDIRFDLKSEKGDNKSHDVALDRTAAQEKARQYVKGFDALGQNTKARITEAIASGARYGAGENTLNAVANVLRLRRLNLTFSEGKQNGYFYEKHGERFAVISPNADAIRTTILHELTHDLESRKNTEAYEKLSKYALKHANPDKIAEITENYERFFKNNGLTFSESDVKSEITAHYVSELLGNSKFLDRYVKHDRTTIEKIKDGLKRLAERFTKVPPSISRLERLYDRALRADRTYLTDAEIAELKGDDGRTIVRYFSKDESGSSSIKEQLRAHKEEVNKLKPAARIEYVKSSKETARKLAIEKLRKIGFVVERQNFGKIEISEGQINESFKYIRTQPEYAALLAVPEILKRGIDISSHTNHKGRSYSTVTFAAPITINGKKGNVAVVVKRTTKDHYSTHRILMPDGSEFVFEETKTEPTPAGINGTDTATSPTISSASDNNISQNKAKVNPENGKKYDLDEKAGSTTKNRTKVLTKMPEKPKASTAEAKRSDGIKTRILFVDEWAGVESEGKRLGSKTVTEKIQRVRAMRNTGGNMLANYQFDPITGELMGDGLNAIFKPIEKGGEQNLAEFYTYLAEKHNISRQAQGKPVTEHTAKESVAIVKAFEKTHPEYANAAGKLYAYQRNLTQFAVESGVMSAELKAKLDETYPFYVPTFRAQENGGFGAAYAGKNTYTLKEATKKATGSTKDILPIKATISRRTVDIIKTGLLNRVATDLYDSAVAKDDFRGIEIIEQTKTTEDDFDNFRYEDVAPKDKTITFFKNGEKMKMKVSDEIFAGFASLSRSEVTSSRVVEVMRAVNRGFKNLVTGYNVFFTATNAIRDFQSGLFYTKYGTKTFLKNYARAWREVKNNSEMWHRYVAVGGLSSSVFDYETGIAEEVSARGLKVTKGKGVVKRTLTHIENANIIVEQMPRFAEFISALESGQNIDRALLDSADITVNFARSGTYTRALNGTVMPFLNAAIQGSSKFIRTALDAKTKGEIGKLVAKAVLMGIVPQLLSQLMYGDDEDYKNLRTADKENFYLIKIGDEFLKLPKGRELSVFAGLANRAAMTVRGEKDAWDGYLENVASQITPIPNMGRTIFSPFTDVATNTTWYGTPIEGRQFDNVAPENRYDESTSSIAIELGKLINYSPKKIHYLLDQFSGIIGDVVLPMTTKRAEKGILENKFTIDPKTQNKLSDQFYKLYDETNYSKSDGNGDDALLLRHLNKTTKAVSELYKKKREIENSDLSDTEKRKQSKAIQALIAQAYKTAIEESEAMRESIRSTAAMAGGELAQIFDEDAIATLRYTEATRQLYGAEVALELYNKDVYEKATLLNKAGIGFNEYYYVYFKVKQIKAGGTKDKRSEVLAAIKAMPISAAQKIVLFRSFGYSVKDGDFKGMTKQKASAEAEKYVRGAKLETSEKAELFRRLGYKVEERKKSA